MCGGTGGVIFTPFSITGLSPRVRGHRRRPLVCLPRSRSIPACAGAPCLSNVLRPVAWVYPRVCGGTFMNGPLTSGQSSLSPRVRGHHLRHQVHMIVFRSIPACAGAPQSLTVSSLNMWVYPRVCGGTGRGTALQMFVSGLSPRVRGHHDVVTHALPALLRRSIPACAGAPCLRS